MSQEISVYSSHYYWLANEQEQPSTDEQNNENSWKNIIFPEHPVPKRQYRSKLAFRQLHFIWSIFARVKFLRDQKGYAWKRILIANSNDGVSFAPASKDSESLIYLGQYPLAFHIFEEIWPELSQQFQVAPFLRR